MKMIQCNSIGIHSVARIYGVPFKNVDTGI
jgi:hypothetical protein